MNQLNIRTPASRNSDGYGSIDAEAAQNDNGWRDSDARKVLCAFVRHPMATTKEISELENLDRVMVGRRAPELRRLHLLDRYHRDEPGQREWRWYPTEAGKAMAGKLEGWR